MKKMDLNRSEYYLSIINDLVESDPRRNLIWKEYHLSVIHDYVSKFNPDLRELSSTVLFKLNLAKFFSVPKLFDTLKKNELVAAFINFLLQLLYGTEFFDNLHEHLRFLLMVLGDAPFLHYDEEHGNQINLLAKVETMANIAGSLVYYIFLFTYEDPEFHTVEERNGVFLDQCRDVLKRPMALLKGNILKFSDVLPLLIDKSPNLSKSKTNSSLFIIDSLICDIENILNRDDSLIVKVKDQINVLRREFMFSMSLLESSIMGSSEIQEHVIGIIDVAYETEYLINSFLARDAPLWYFSMRLPHISHKIKLIETALQEIKNNYNIGSLNVANTFSISQQLPLQAKRNYEADDNIVVGFDDMVTNILDKLVGGTDQLQIIFIFGMAGLGKTTFAKTLYNHPMVHYRFDRRSWCVVSQMYRRKSLLTQILLSSSIDHLDKDEISDIVEEESLALKIYQRLKGRRYLAVIDDVWDINAWDDLRRCFPDDRNGSRILITSRNKNMAPPNSIICPLPYLSNEQCWELLEKKVFKDKSCPLQLIGVGKEHAANCHGLPLVVVVLAGILSTTDKEESAWKEVGEKLFSYSSCAEDDSMTQILELSYKHLPQYLKPCFLYFGVFAEDKEISTQKLMQLWVAEGFIPKDKENRKSPEPLAEECLMGLIDRSLIMVAKRSSDGRVKTCLIHDRLRDLCLKISEEENFLTWVGNNKYSIYEKNHHLVQQSPNTRIAFSPYCRSFHGFRPIFLASMKLIRVLDIVCMTSQSRLIGVAYLVNLRYLVIHGKYMSSIGIFVNLEYLHVDNDANYSDIPFLILKMDKLRYLYFTDRRTRFGKDCKPSKTNNLQVLFNVSVYNLKDEEMLKCSPFLRKLNCCCEPFYVEEKGACRYFDLLFFTHLESLRMEGRFIIDYDQILEINFPSNIKKLNLHDLRLPLVNMSIIGRLPNLQVLKLTGEVFEGETWDTREGEFQQLTFLKLYSTNFKQWDVASSEHFPKLQQLHLHLCYYLEEIPCEIGEIPTLQLIELVSCGKTLDESARNIEQEQRDMGNEELKVIIGK